MTFSVQVSGFKDPVIYTRGEVRQELKAIVHTIRNTFDNMEINWSQKRDFLAQMHEQISSQNPLFDLYTKAVSVYNYKTPREHQLFPDDPTFKLLKKRSHSPRSPIFKPHRRGALVPCL